MPSIFLSLALLSLATHIPIGRCSSVDKTDCTREFCQIQLSPNLMKRYRILVPEGNTDSMCPHCMITIQLELDGYSWVGIGISRNGGMVGSHVVIGEPGMSEPKSYFLDGKSQSLITQSDMRIVDSTIDFINGQTVMEFTTSFASLGIQSPLDVEPMGISLQGKSSFIWAHGNDGENVLKYHGSNNKATYILDDIAGVLNTEINPNKMTMSKSITNTKSSWVIHGIIAFFAWGIFAPLAIATALLHDFDGSHLLNIGERVAVKICKFLGKENAVLQPSQALKNRVRVSIWKWWFYIHVGCNSVNYLLTLVVFSIAISTINREGSPKWHHAHSKMGITIFSLATFQVIGGFLRPSKPTIPTASDKTSHGSEEENEFEVVPFAFMKSTKRQIWELFHSVLGITLFVFGVWQMYQGMELYHQRYGNSSFIVISLFYILWMGMWTLLIVGITVYRLFYQKEGVKYVEAQNEAAFVGDNGREENDQVELRKSLDNNSTKNEATESKELPPAGDGVFL